MRVLVVEDQPDLAFYTAKALRESGGTVDAVATLGDASDAVSVSQFDVLVLDRKLPDGDSIDWLKALRRQGVTTPALVLTATATSLDERIGGLYAGADDYLAKPVALAEVVARVRALIRRNAASGHDVITVGDASLDMATGQVRIRDACITLKRRESRLLELLMRRAGSVVSRNAIEQQVYSHDEEVSPNAIEVMVHRLRSTLAGQGANAEIHTVRGVGYLLRETASTLR